MNKYASIISKIGTNPGWVLVWGILLAIIMESKFGFSIKDYIGIAILSIWTFGVGILLRKEFDLENKNRKYRTYFLSIFIFGWMAVSILYWSMFSDIMRDALLLALSIITIILINNVFYRISFHVGLTTSLLILINHFTEWNLLFLYLIVPIIGWSRVYLKKHTLLQVIAGFLVPFAVYFTLIATDTLT